VIGYFKDEANYIVGKTNKIVVTDHSGTVLRRREAIFESGTGNLNQVSIYLANGSKRRVDREKRQLRYPLGSTHHSLIWFGGCFLFMSV
jgi:hypothetical protein